MFPLTQYFLFSVILFSFGCIIAQTTYESPHVKDSSTIQFTFPSDYHEVVDIEQNVAQVFTTEENLTAIELGRVISSMPVLMVLHLPAEDNSPESILTKLKNSFGDDENEMTVIESPKISMINGREVVLAAAMGKVDGDVVDGVYFSAIHSGDYYVMIFYKALEGSEGHLKYGKFKTIIESWKEVATKKESGVYFPNGEQSIVGYEIEAGTEHEQLVTPPQPPPVDSPTQLEENNIKKILDGHYKNDMFQTAFSHRDVLPDLAKNWSVPMTGNTHLLIEFVYNDDQGSIKIFSGGDALSYASSTEMGIALQLAIGIAGSLEIMHNSQISNGIHLFENYTISGSRGGISSFYTTKVNGELLFFVVDGGPNPVDDFKPAVRDFMLTMWIDYFGDDFEE